MNKNISVLTRRNLLDGILKLGNIEGRLELTDFLAHIWPIDKLKSTDQRFQTAREDIWQHMINNYDWDENFLYWTYFNIGECEDTVLFRFLEQVVHPIVRLDKVEQQKYMELVNNHLEGDGFQLEITDSMSGYPIYSVIKLGRGVQGNIKNLIFAANKYKPEIILKNSMDNEIEIVRNHEYCLVYDRTIPPNGLLWLDLINWWRETRKVSGTDWEVGNDLYRRLFTSLASSPFEKIFFQIYFEEMLPLLGDELPAIIPQVYLHYDPYTLKKLKGERRLPRERMDFLFLLKNRARVVVEIDGKHHYADEENGQANVYKYAAMVKEDRELKLKGYEVFRLGGGEFSLEGKNDFCKEFLRRLFVKHLYLPE